MIRSIATSGFRNLENQTWHPALGRNVVLGDNGSGKTSLLEAVYLALTTKSFRTNQLADCVCHGGSSFHVGAAATAALAADLEVGWASGYLRHALNGKTSSLGQHLAVAPVLAWTAAESDLLTGAPELRRRFIDRALVGAHPPALQVLSRYRRILSQKRLVLAAGGSGVEPWNELLATAGAELIRLRASALLALRRALHQTIVASGLGFGDLELRYSPSPPDGESGCAAIAAAIEKLHHQEKRRRTPLVGPHRDDVVFLWRGHELRRAVSAGERKALGLALVAAQGDILTAAGRPPLFLLDDTDAELDRTALRRVWNAYSPTAQIFASSNRPEVWAASMGDRFWRVSGGRITPADTSETVDPNH